MQWIPATHGQIPYLETAFSTLREERADRYVSYLAQPGILDFHRDNLISRIQKKPGDSGLFLLMKENKLLALTGIEPSPWHRERLGMPYFKIQPLFCFATQNNEVSHVAESLRFFFTQPGAVYTTRVEAQQHPLVYHLASYGFTPVGTSVRLVRDGGDRKRVDSYSRCPYDNFNIRPFSETDLPKLQDIIRRSHRHSHFFCEARFEPERVKDLFAEWIGQCAANPVFRISIAEAEGEIIGFCSAFIQKSLERYIGRPIGIIDFIVVDYGIQGRGIGRGLLEAASGWLDPITDCIELRTMADNLQAIRFYEKNGFRMLSADQHFHFWTHGGAEA